MNTHLLFSAINRQVEAIILSSNSKLAYPTRNIDDSVDSMKKAYETAKKTTFTRQEYADANNMTNGGGAYNQLVGSLSSFKLVETGNSQVIFTDLGKRAVFGKEDEIKQAKQEAVRNIPMFTEIFNRSGPNFSSEQIRIYLKNECNVDFEHLDNHLSKVIQSLKSNLPYLTAVKQPEKPKSIGREEGETSDDTSILGNGEALIISKFGRLKIQDEGTLSLARMYLSYIEQQMKVRKTTPKIVTDSEQTSLNPEIIQ